MHESPSKPESPQPPSPLGELLESLTSGYQQLLDATMALNVAGISYAVCGGFAVSMWALKHDIEALQSDDARSGRLPKPLTVVNSRDADILICSKDLDTVKTALCRAGFEQVEKGKLVGFMRRSACRSDFPSKQRIRRLFQEGIHLLFAGKPISDECAFTNPDPAQSVAFSDVFGGSDYTLNIVDIEPLLLMKLCSVRKTRLKDLVHLLELWESGAVNDQLIDRVVWDPSWFVGDRLDSFHKRFQEAIDECRERGLRRYEVIGKQVKEKFYEIINRARNVRPTE